MKPLAHLLAIVFAFVLAGVGVFLVFYEHAQLATSIGLQVLVGICLVAAPLLAIPAEAQQAGEAAIALYKKFKGNSSGGAQ
jgi:hypothetical protein